MKKYGLALALATAAMADIGVLLPRDKIEPDQTLLAIDEVAIKVTIVNGNAKVQVKQVFANRKELVQEGTYVFALPERALISDFAVWDDVVRIPGVILERKRAEEIYNEIRAQQIDPGLLRQGEASDDSTKQANIFTAKVVPIPPFGNKRLEMEYQERIAVDNLQGYFSLPLKPDSYKAQTIGHLTIEFEMKSNHRMKSFEVQSKSLPLQISAKTANRVAGRYEGRNVVLGEDFTVVYGLDASKGDELEVAAYREPGGEAGFFEASALLTMPSTTGAAAGAAVAPPKTVVAVYDASVSMQWQKLEQGFAVLEATLKSLSPQDRFNLIVFNSEVATFSPAPVAATPDAVEKSLAFVRATRLRGGTNLQAALDAALQQKGENSYLVLISDGGLTRGIIQPGKLSDWYAGQWNQKAELERPRTYVFGVGDDANLVLLRFLSRQNGLFEWIRTGESLEYKLKTFLSKIGTRPVENLRLTAPAGTDLVYALDESAFPGSSPAWVGRYARPGAAAFSISGQRDSRPLTAQASVTLPVTQTAENQYLPREWAKARVDALLDKINREGEDRATIDEIIRLSRKYKFVTPYTAFLAAPRSLLRPRLIRPGDPVLRIKTDAAIKSVVAMFPFGLVKKLRYLEGEDVWQMRFLAPSDMKDGTYQVQLLLKDAEGHVYREQKSFVIASQGPVVRVRTDKARYRGGETVALKVSASETTRTITARLYGAMPARLKWNPEMKSNTGNLVVPASLPAGKYTVTVTAEDFAHNISSQEVAIEVVP